MRSRATLLVLLVGGLAAAGSVARAGTLGLDQLGSGRPAVGTAAVAQSEVSDPPALGAVSRTRDALERDGERRLLTFAVIGAIALLVVAAWWTAVGVRTRPRHTRVHVGAGPRAPPTLPELVVSF
ncbi:MAG: hypothetical protein QOF40_2625 [Actinomycetota bacterium]|nr:hypothetical protein [Actinomycetota bacterium]